MTGKQIKEQIFSKITDSLKRRGHSPILCDAYWSFIKRHLSSNYGWFYGNPQLSSQINDDVLDNLAEMIVDLAEKNVDI